MAAVTALHASSLPGLAAGIQHMAAVQQPAGEPEHLHPQERVSYL